MAAEAEIYSSSEFDDGGYFDVTDASGTEHWCYVFSTDAEEGYRTPHFVLHTACLTILQYALEDRHPDSAVHSLNDFYKALCGPENKLDAVCVSLKKGHYGAEQFWEQDWVAKQGWEVRVSTWNGFFK